MYIQDIYLWNTFEELTQKLIYKNKIYLLNYEELKLDEIDNKI